MKNLVSIIVLVLSSVVMVAQNDIGNKIDNYLARTVDYGFSGAAVVSKDGNIILNKGYGLADKAKGKSNTKNSVYSTGSVTKQFTAAAIMKLEMMGKLTTNDKITQYFDKVPSDKSNISIHNLLTHTSGLPGELGGDFESILKEDYINQAMEVELEFAPGKEFSYSNVGYSLLAMIIEKQSGITYEEFLKKNFFDPIGMKQTGYKLPSWDKKNFAQIYGGNQDNGSSERFTKPTWHLIGKGGILSTTSDIITWVKALSSEKILSYEAKKKMFTPYRNEYGYGWDVIDDGALRQHDGGSTLGLSAELRWFVEDDVIIMLFCNASIGGKPGFTVLREDLEALAMGEDISLPPSIKTIKTNPEAYVGQYEFPSGQQFSIGNNNETLFITVDNQELLDLLSNPKEYGKKSPSAELNSKFDMAFNKAIKQGDFSGFAFTNAEEELKKEIKNEIKMEGLRNPHYKVVKTTRSTRNENLYITQVALSEDPNFNDESMILSIVTEDSKYAGLGIDFGYAGPVNLTLYPIGKHKFQAYSLSTKMGAVLEIKSTNGSCTFLVNGVPVSGITKQ